MSYSEGIFVINITHKQLKPFFNKKESLTLDDLKNLIGIYDSAKNKDLELDLSYDDALITKIIISDTAIKLLVLGENWSNISSVLMDVNGIEFWSYISDDDSSYMQYCVKYKETLFNEDLNMESDERSTDTDELVPKWYSTMPDNILNLVAKESDIPKIHKSIEKYNKKKQIIEYKSLFYKKNGMKDSLFLSLRIKGKKIREKLYSTLNAYVNDPTNENFIFISNYLNKTIKDIHRKRYSNVSLFGRSFPKYPVFSKEYPGPLELAKGLCFVEEGGFNGIYLYLGFSIDDISAYSCEVINGENENKVHLINLCFFYEYFGEKISGEVKSSNQDNDLTLWRSDDGYLFLT